MQRSGIGWGHPDAAANENIRDDFLLKMIMSEDILITGRWYTASWSLDIFDICHEKSGTTPIERNYKFVKIDYFRITAKFKYQNNFIIYKAQKW